MSLVVFVAELGSGFGHARRLWPVARKAAAAGHRPLFLLPNPAEAAVMLEGLEVRPTPPLPAPTGGVPFVARSFADILGRAGFGDRSALDRVVRRWDAALDELQPDAVVCEFSPFLALAASGSALPVLSLGHGFVLPPPHLLRFPALLPGPPAYDEESLLAVASAVARSRGLPSPAALPAILGGTAHFVTGLAALDPYAALRLHRPVGPPGLPPPILVDEPEPGDLFAYLLGDAPSTLAVLQALARSGKPGSVFVRRGAAAHRDAVVGSPITWLVQPAPTPSALRRARLVVHHGSMLLTEEALLAGRPQLVVPLYLEHLLTARSLQALGAGHVVRASAPPAAVAAALEAAWSDPASARAARRFAVAARSVVLEDLPARLLATVVKE